MPDDKQVQAVPEVAKTARRKVIAAIVLILLAAAVVGYQVVNLNRNSNEVKLNQRVPDFSLRASDGSITTLKSLQKSGTPVLVFYRGHW